MSWFNLEETPGNTGALILIIGFRRNTMIKLCRDYKVILRLLLGGSWVVISELEVSHL